MSKKELRIGYIWPMNIQKMNNRNKLKYYNKYIQNILYNKETAFYSKKGVTTKQILVQTKRNFNEGQN